MRVLIIDDHTLFADALALALEAKGLAVTNAANGTRALEIAATEQFDLVLLDMILPDIHGEVLLKSLKQDKPNWKIIVVSSISVDKARISRLGADGFINKAEKIGTMLQAIDSVLAGQSYFDNRAEVSDILNEYLLTPRQLDIVKAMSLGLSNKQIAHNLNISEGTVKQHINRTFKSLDVKSRTQCVHKLAQLGLISGT